MFARLGVIALAAATATAVLSASGAASGATAAGYVSIPALISGHGYDGTVIGSGRAGHPMSLRVDFGAAPEGAVSQLVVIGRPGSTPDATDAPGAVMRSVNQLPVTQQFQSTALAVQFAPTRAGAYPVFVFSSGDLGCASPTMEDEDINFTITQVGVLDIS